MLLPHFTNSIQNFCLYNLICITNSLSLSWDFSILSLFYFFKLFYYLFSALLPSKYTLEKLGEIWKKPPAIYIDFVILFIFFCKNFFRLLVFSSAEIQNIINFAMHFPSKKKKKPWFWFQCQPLLFSLKNFSPSYVTLPPLQYH